MLAVAVIIVAITLNVSFVRFCPASCLAGHDNIADIKDSGLAWTFRASAVGQFDVPVERGHCLVVLQRLRRPCNEE